MNYTAVPTKSLILFTFITAFFIEGLGSLVSVIGISALFGHNLIISSLIVGIDVGKIIIVSAFFNYWRKMPKPMLGFAIIALAISMAITSAGAAGYLHGEFQKAMIGSQEGASKIAILKAQQEKYQERKRQIDDQIASLPARTTVNQRLKLMNGFKEEQQQLDLKISEIDKQLPELQISQISVEAKSGPITNIAKAFSIPIEVAINWVVGAIMIVFDPLAIFLVLLGNFFLMRRRISSNTEILEKKTTEPPAPLVSDEATIYVSEPIARPKEKTAQELVTPPKSEMTEVVPTVPAKEEIVELPTEPVVALDEVKVEPKVEDKPTVVETVHDQSEPEAEAPQKVPSSLHLIKEDPSTITNASDEIDFKMSNLRKDLISTS